jgi:predicted transcriptional regulator
LPDRASWDHILYELHVERKIEAGLAAMTEGKTVAHEDARRRWLDG